MGLFSFNKPSPFKGQKFEELKKKAQDSGTLFVDPEFPANDKSLFFSNAKLGGLQWKRPKDICSNPQLFVEGTSSNDVTQGQLGNCWFVAACSCLAIDKEIWTKVIPDHKEQEWDAEHPENYAGIFHFRFWNEGEWTDVVIDDFLPVRGNQLVFVHSKSTNEFWSALLEKAYAKLYGCYEILDGGELAEALEDFTGGIAEPLDLVAGKYSELDDERDKLFKVMKKERNNRALLAAAIPAKSSSEMEQSTDIGLVIGHAYGITAVKRVALEGSGLFNFFNRDKLSMVRLRNPWGGSEWKGAFSDGSPEWNRIDQNEREKIGLTFEEDGEFWMTMEDFCKYFTNLSICRVVNTSFISLQKRWHDGERDSEWTKERSGGCINNRETFMSNPQFRFDQSTDGDDEMLFGLMQKGGRGIGKEKLVIGFTIMKVELNREYRCMKVQEIIKSSQFKNARTIFLRHTLPRGRYVLVATTFDPGHIGQILLRAYGGSSVHLRELVLEKPEPSFFNQCSCIPFLRYPTLVTRVTVYKAVNLENQDKTGEQRADSADPYVFFVCEQSKVHGPTVQDSLNPEWNASAIFYRKDPVNKPIQLEVWNKNKMRDQFMGVFTLTDIKEQDKTRMEVDLYGKGDKKDTKVGGRMLIEVTTTSVLNEL